MQNYEFGMRNEIKAPLSKGNLYFLFCIKFNCLLLFCEML